MFQPLQSLLHERAAASPVLAQVADVMVAENAHHALIEFFGEVMAAYSEVVGFRNGVLMIAVSSPVVGSEIKLSEADFLLHLKKKLGRDMVKRIRYVIRKES